MLSVLFLCLLSAFHSQKIGFLISSSDKYKTALQHIVEDAANNSSLVSVVMGEYEPTMRGITTACCSLVDAGVVAIIASSTSTDTAIQADFLSPLKVPLLAVSATDPYLPTSTRDYLLRMSPSDKYQSRAIFDFIKHFQWKHISILASTDAYGLHGLLELHHLLIDESGYTVDKVVFFQGDDAGAFSVNRELEELKNSLARVVVLNCGVAYGKLVLETAHEMGMMHSGFVWIVTDAIASQPSALAHDGVFLSFYEGLIGLRPAVYKNKRYREYKDDFLQKNHTYDELITYALMAYDAVGIMASAIESLVEIPEQNAGCSSVEGWSGGEELIAALRNMTYTGITGKANFTECGESRRVVYDILNFRDNRFEVIGTWHNTSGLKITGETTFLGSSDHVPSGVANDLNGRHLHLGALNEGPFMYVATDKCEGNDCWTGICPDIVRRLSEDLGFTYNFLLPLDGKWGGFNETTEMWDGMVEEVMTGRIDMIAMHFSTNSARKEVLDFSSAFMDSRIAAVVLGESETRSSFFFLSSLNAGVWLSVLAANILITVLIWLYSKISPFDKSWSKVHAMQTCHCDCCTVRRVELHAKKTAQFGCLIEELQEETNSGDISFYESVWLTGTGLVSKTSKILPYCLPGRFLLFSWWFFMLLIISVYTANLTAFLTLKNIDTSINNIKELLHQDDYQWGFIGSGHPETLLLTHSDPIYTMLVKKGVILETLEEGLEKVRGGHFIFIDEKPVIAHHLSKDCDMSYVGDGFQPFDYAFGLAKDSPYTSLIDKQILKYREEGFVDEVWEKWSPGSSSCASHKVGNVMTLDMENLSGMFYILAIAVTISIALIIVELIYASVLDTRRNKELSLILALKRRLLLIKGNIFNDRQGHRALLNKNGNSTRLEAVEGRIETGGAPFRTIGHI